MVKINLKSIEDAYFGQPVYVYDYGKYRKIIVKSRKVTLFKDKVTVTYYYELDTHRSTLNDIGFEYREFIKKSNKRKSREVKK